MTPGRSTSVNPQRTFSAVGATSADVAAVVVTVTVNGVPDGLTDTVEGLTVHVARAGTPEHTIEAEPRYPELPLEAIRLYTADCPALIVAALDPLGAGEKVTKGVATWVVNSRIEDLPIPPLV